MIDNKSKLNIENEKATFARMTSGKILKKHRCLNKLSKVNNYYYNQKGSKFGDWTGRRSNKKKNAN